MRARYNAVLPAFIWFPSYGLPVVQSSWSPPTQKQVENRQTLGRESNRDPDKKCLQQHKPSEHVKIWQNRLIWKASINSVQTRCIVKGEAQKSPLFWRFSGGFWFSQDRLFSRNSTRKPLNLIKSPIFTNAPCKTACLYNAPSMHTLDSSTKMPRNFRPNFRPIFRPHFRPTHKNLSPQLRSGECLL